MLGYLGHPNVTLILAAAGLWTILGLMALITKRMRVQLVSLISVFLLCIMIVVAIWNMIRNSALHRFVLKLHLWWIGVEATFSKYYLLNLKLNLIAK